MLEKAINGDDPLRERLIISEFSLGARKYTGRTFAYLLDSASNAIGDFTALTDRQFLIIERDGGQGDASDVRFTAPAPARFKKIFKIDLGVSDANGNLVKQEVADLMNIYDPRDIAGDGRTKTVFTFPFVTIEDVLVLDNNRLLVINDNNYPGSAGREFGVPDNNELIVIHTAPLLEGKACLSGERKDHKHDRDEDDRDDSGVYRGRDEHERDGHKPECRPAKE